MRRTSMLSVAFAVVVVAGTCPAQISQSPLRTVRGQVVDTAGESVPSAIVYLYDQRTQAVRTYITGDSGLYKFSGLQVADDYEVHAEHADLTSDIHEVSHLDARRDFVIELRVEKKQSASNASAVRLRHKSNGQPIMKNSRSREPIPALNTLPAIHRSGVVVVQRHAPCSLFRISRNVSARGPPGSTAGGSEVHTMRMAKTLMNRWPPYSWSAPTKRPQFPGSAGAITVGRFVQSYIQG